MSITYNGDGGYSGGGGGTSGGSQIPPSVYLPAGGTSYGSILSSSDVGALTTLLNRQKYLLGNGDLTTYGKNFYLGRIAEIEGRINLINSNLAEYDKLYTKEYSNFIDGLSVEYSKLVSNYSNDVFGSPIDIGLLEGEIYTVESQLELLILQDYFTSMYDTIQNSDNSKEITKLEQTLSELQLQQEHLTSEYDKSKRAFVTSLNQSESDNWDVDYFWATEKAFDAGLGGGYAPVTQSDTLNFMQSGEVNDWMAGGNLYDSPRAGGQLFNVTGDMNTVRFLGLQDKNYNAHLQRELNGMAQLHKMLGVNAGSKSFSIL